jgi:tetratricopeptide (TPR) repeat protein
MCSSYGSGNAMQKALTVLFSLMALAGSCFAMPELPPDLHALALETIDLIYKEKFPEAQESAKKIIKKYSDNPAGYFFYAVVLDLWTEFYQSDKKEDEFYRYCELAVEKGQAKAEREPKNPWHKFFIGGTEGLKGQYERRYERWITAFRYGWKGVSVLKDISAANPDLHDANYGIGTYDYWRSAMTKVLLWMPGVEDKRASGIARLRDAREKGIYTSFASSVGLMAIMHNEKKYDEELRLAQEMLKKYPACVQFHWAKAMALFETGQYPEAEQEFKIILARVESEEFDNHYNAIVCHFWMAKICLKQKRYTQFLAEYNRMRYYRLTDDIKKRLEKHFSESDAMKNQADALTH